jgi:hypothetical protein
MNYSLLKEEMILKTIISRYVYLMKELIKELKKKQNHAHPLHTFTTSL